MPASSGHFSCKSSQKRELSFNTKKESFLPETPLFFCIFCLQDRKYTAKRGVQIVGMNFQTLSSSIALKIFAWGKSFFPAPMPIFLIL